MLGSVDGMKVVFANTIHAATPPAGRISTLTAGNCSTSQQTAASHDLADKLEELKVLWFSGSRQYNGPRRHDNNPWKRLGRGPLPGQRTSQLRLLSRLR